MSTEALVLSLTTVVRPTSAAALVAMLSTPHPKRLLVAYLIAGLVFSIAIGTVVVVLLGGRGTASTAPALRPSVDVVLGSVALVYAVCTWFEWWPRPRPERPAEQDSWMRGRLQNLTPRGAAAVGVLTHLPGLVYLAALNAIVASAPGPVVGVLQVVLYNAVWFSLAIVALVLSVYRPTVSRDLMDQLASWSRRNRRVIIVVFSGVLGAYLLVTGAVALLGQPA